MSLLAIGLVIFFLKSRRPEKIPISFKPLSLNTNFGSKPKSFKFLYEDHLSLKEKITRIALKIYRAKDVDFSDSALHKLESLEKNYAHLPVCIAKTPYSFSSDPNAHGASRNHTLMIRELRLARGAGFVVAICGDLMTMPGLPKIPASENIRLTSEGLLEGLN